jgi:hypothetical protein
MSDSYDDYEVKIQLAEHEWEMVKTEHDRAVELGKAYERGWNAALAQQEPVAWLKTWSDGSVSVLKTKSHAFADHELEPLYTAPPKKEWVGLTEEEIISIGNTANLKAKATSKGIIIHPEGIKKFYQTIEAKLKERNT